MSRKSTLLTLEPLLDSQTKRRKVVASQASQKFEEENLFIFLSRVSLERLRRSVSKMLLTIESENENGKLFHHAVRIITDNKKRKKTSELLQLPTLLFAIIFSYNSSELIIFWFVKEF